MDLNAFKDIVEFTETHFIGIFLLIVIFPFVIRILQELQIIRNKQSSSLRSADENRAVLEKINDLNRSLEELSVLINQYQNRTENAKETMRVRFEHLLQVLNDIQYEVREIKSMLKASDKNY